MPEQVVVRAGHLSAAAQPTAAARGVVQSGPEVVRVALAKLRAQASVEVQPTAVGQGVAQSGREVVRAALARPMVQASVGAVKELVPGGIVALSRAAAPKLVAPSIVWTRPSARSSGRRLPGVGYPLSPM